MRGTAIHPVLEEERATAAEHLAAARELMAAAVQEMRRVEAMGHGSRDLAITLTNVETGLKWLPSATLQP